jgi:hypothetical protein
MRAIRSRLSPIVVLCGALCADAKIADFGLSRTRKNAEKSGGSKGIAGAGTPAYMVLTCCSDLSYACDVLMAL